jgi:hypothetical protein
MSTENQAFEYALGLFAVLIGLAITDIAASFHRLLRAKSQVTWDPLTLLAAFYALCMAVYMWFDIWGVRHFHLTRHFFFYIGLIVQLFLLYLIAAASLPDEQAEGRVDLREYYAGNRQHFWRLMAIFQMVYFAFGVYFSGGEQPGLPRYIVVLMWCLVTAPILVSLLLLQVKSRAVHYLGLAVLYIVMTLHYAAMEIN